MNKAVFLDRDGVINTKGKSYYISREEEFIFNQAGPHRFLIGNAKVQVLCGKSQIQ